MELLNLPVCVYHLKGIRTDIMAVVGDWVCVITNWFSSWFFLRASRVTFSSYILWLSSLKEFRSFLSLLTTQHHSCNRLINISSILCALTQLMVFFLILFIRTFIILLLVLFDGLVRNSLIFLIIFCFNRVIFYRVVALLIRYSLNFRNLRNSSLIFFVAPNLCHTLIMFFKLMFEFSVFIQLLWFLHSSIRLALFNRSFMIYFGMECALLVQMSGLTLSYFFHF